MRVVFRQNLEEEEGKRGRVSKRVGEEGVDGRLNKENSRFPATVDLTLVGTETSVNPTMSSERGRVREGLLTFVADVRSLSSTREGKKKKRPREGRKGVREEEREEEDGGRSPLLRLLCFLREEEKKTTDPSEPRVGKRLGFPIVSS